MTIQYRYEDILDMLPAFALGTLDADEMLAVEEYLQTHGTPDLLARLETFEDSAALLALQAPAQPLPLHVKSQLFDAIAADLAITETRQTSTTQPRVPVARPRPQVQSQTTPNPLTQLWDMIGGFLRPAAWVGVGALLTFFLLQTVSPSNAGELAAAQTEIQRLQGELQLAQDTNDSLQEINQSLQSQLNRNNQQLAVLAGSIQSIPLAGQEAAPNASGALYVGQGESLLVLSGLEVLSEEQTYQLWLIPAEGNPVPSGLLAVQEAGVDSLTVTLPDDASRYAAVGVSIEPAGGSTAPTGPIVLVGLTSS
jgi:anti-sigma-K factor RskA